MAIMFLSILSQTENLKKKGTRDEIIITIIHFKEFLSNVRIHVKCAWMTKCIKQAYNLYIVLYISCKMKTFFFLIVLKK